MSLRREEVFTVEDKVRAEAELVARPRCWDADVEVYTALRLEM